MIKPLILYIFISIFSILALADACEKWDFINPLPQGNTIRAVTHDGNQYIAVGQYGLIMTSPDGEDWTIRRQRKAQPLMDCCASPLGIVAVGLDGLVLRSDDGVDWVPSFIPGTDLHAITYAQGLFIVVGDSGKIYTSVNADTWLLRDSHTTVDLSDVCLGAGQFLAVGSDGTLCSSVNGATWTATDGLLGIIEDFYFVRQLNDQVVITGNHGTVLFSPDGSTWHSRPTLSVGFPNTSAFAIDELFFVYAHHVFFWSEDGTNWQSVSASPQEVQDVFVVNHTVLAVGGGGRIHSSDNGLIWEFKSTAWDKDLYTITYGMNQFLAVGPNGQIMTSPDGETWDFFWTDPLRHSRYSVDTFNGKYIAVGSNQHAGNAITIDTSVDGVSWDSQACPTNQYLMSVCHNRGRAVAVGENGVILHSSDGTTWSFASITGTPTSFSSVCHAQIGAISQFVTVGYNGAIFRSSDGISWQPAFSSGVTTTNPLRSVTARNGKFVAVGDLGVIITSMDGDVWTQQTPLTNGNLQTVFHDGKKFRAFAQNDGIMLFSDNATTWHSESLFVDSFLHGGAGNGNRVVLVGSDGIILKLRNMDPSSWPNPDRVTDLVNRVNEVCF